MSNEETILLKKMTVKTLFGMSRDEDAKKYFRNLADEAGKGGAELAVIGGKVNGYGNKATQFGDSTFLTGFFVAQNRQDGKLYRSGVLYLPKGTAEALAAAFEKRNEKADWIRFQLTLSVTEDSKSAVGYTFICESARDTETLNEEKELLQAFDMLPAPKKLKAISGKK